MTASEQLPHYWRNSLAKLEDKGERFYVGNDYRQLKYVHVQQAAGDTADRSRNLFYDPDKTATDKII